MTVIELGFSQKDPSHRSRRITEKFRQQPASWRLLSVVFGGLLLCDLMVIAVMFDWSGYLAPAVVRLPGLAAQIQSGMKGYLSQGIDTARVAAVGQLYPEPTTAQPTRTQIAIKTSTPTSSQAILITSFPIFSQAFLITNAHLNVTETPVQRTLQAGPEMSGGVPLTTRFEPLPITLTATDESEPTATETVEPTPTEESPPQPEEQAAVEEGLPDNAMVDGVTGFPQSLPLSCESRSAVDWARFFGYDINELDFQYMLPFTDNPETGFVGDPRNMAGGIPPYSYGVYAGPVAALLRAYGVPAGDHRGMSYDDLRREIAAGKPVIVWVISGVIDGKGVPYTASDGQTTTVAALEHTVMIVGYTSEVVVVQDGGWRYNVPVERFLRSWGVLENRAVTVD